MLNNFFISDAFAQAADAVAPAATNEFSFSSFVPLIAIFAIFYFLIVRPQTKKMKAHQQMVSNLKSGDKVVTTGGIVGVVKGVFEKENQVEVEIADNVRVKLLRQYVSEVVVPEITKK